MKNFIEQYNEVCQKVNHLIKNDQLREAILSIFTHHISDIKKDTNHYTPDERKTKYEAGEIDNLNEFEKWLREYFYFETANMINLNQLVLEQDEFLESSLFLKSIDFFLKGFGSYFLSANVYELFYSSNEIIHQQDPTRLFLMQVVNTILANEVLWSVGSYLSKPSLVENYEAKIESYLNPAIALNFLSVLRRRDGNQDLISDQPKWLASYEANNNIDASMNEENQKDKPRRHSI